MKILTLGEYKNNLPIGIDKDSNDKSFSFRSWGLNEEKEISEMKQKSDNMGTFVNKILCFMLKDLAGSNFIEKSENEKLIMLNQMKLMDVLYLYIYLRFDQLDECLRMDVTCPTCGKLNKDFIADLKGLDISVIEANDDEKISYELKKKFTINETDIKIINFKRTPWDAMEKATDDIFGNSGKMMELIFNYSITGINNQSDFIDLSDILKGIRKKDFEKLSNKMNQHNAGPKLQISDNCKFCKKVFFQQLNWSYDDFFGSSSLPQD